MYTLINNNIAVFTHNVGLELHFRAYCELINRLTNENVSENEEYKRKYVKYWGLNGAGLNQNFKDQYFNLLQEIKRNVLFPFSIVVDRLYATPVNNTGIKKIQFSFATKLLHMVDNTKPIYDSRIHDFFFLFPIKGNPDYHKRKNQYMKQYNFLVKEYNRILTNNLLSDSITFMRGKFELNEAITDIKIIDSIIWSFVNYLRKGGIEDGDILYQ